MYIVTEFTNEFYTRNGKEVGNVRHSYGEREKFHWVMDERCDLCAATERLSRTQEELRLVEERYWRED